MTTLMNFSFRSYILVFFLLFTSIAADAQIYLVNTGTSSFSGQTFYYSYVGTGAAGVAGTTWGHQWTQSGFLAAGATASIGIGGGFTPNTNVFIGWFGGNGVVPNQIQEITTDASGNGLGSVIFYMGGTPTPPCLTNLTWAIQNQGQYTVSYFAENFDTRVYYNYGGGAPPGGATVESVPQDVPPGGTGYIFVDGIACSNANQWVVCTVSSYLGTGPTNPLTPVGVPLYNQPAPVGDNGYIPPLTSAPASGQGTGLNLPAGVGQYNPTNGAVLGTNSPILFSAAATNATGIAIQQGDAALYTAVVNGFNQNHSDEATINTNVAQVNANLSAINATDGRGDSNIVAAVNNLTNGLASINTNLSSGWPSINTNLWSINTNITILNTNLYTRLTNVDWAVNNLTNFLTNSTVGTNADADLMASLEQPASTNDTYAVSAALSAEGNSGFDGFSNSMNSFIPSDANGSGAPPMTMSFVGTTIDLNPIDEFPGVATFSYYAFKSLLILIFLIDVSRMYWELVKAKGSTQQGRVPNMDTEGGGSVLGIGFTAGGNWVGLMTFFLIPALFIGLFTGAMSYLFSNLGVSVAAAMNLTSFQTNIGTIGWYLLSTLFPVNTFFTLLCARITLQFSLAHLYSVASDAAHWLLG